MNISGLSIAILCVMFIYLWVQDELSFDKFHSNSNKICRLVMDMNQYGKLAITPPPSIDKIKLDFPEITDATRVEDCPKIIMKNGDRIYYEDAGIFADQSFFDIFSFKLKKGDIGELLHDPLSVVITEKIAEKYFGDDDPLNKELTLDGHPIQITGVLENVPANSHLQFDFILPFTLAAQLGKDLNDWGDVSLYTYILLDDGVSFTDMNEKIKKWETPREESFYLQSLEEIHTETSLIADNAIVVNKVYINIFIAIAFFILLIASVNYISIYVSSSFNRGKEIGIRKINGSGRVDIIMQFLSESVIYVVISLSIAFALFLLLLPQFNQITGKQLSVNLNDSIHLVWLLAMGLVLFISIGFYPAMLFSSVKPEQALKNNKNKPGLLSRLKNGMVLIQFSVTTFLIIGAFTVSLQLNFIKSKDLGFNKENIVYIPFNGLGEHYSSFKQELLKNTSIISVSAKNSLPTETSNKTNELSWPGKAGGDEVLVEATAVDFDYVETLGLNIAEGRNFSSDLESDKMGILLNQTAVNQMNLKDPVGKTINLWGYQLSILGVVKDAIFYSLKEKIEPQIFYIIDDINGEEMSYYGVMLMKIKGDKVHQTLADIEATGKKFYSDIPFNFHFLDETIESKYWEEQRLFSVARYFVFVSILLSCFGLFGMSLFSVRQRVKEIGIRKVNGAKTSEIFTLLNKDFVKWVLISYVIGAPVAYYTMHKWLENFAYKTDLSWWIFALAGALALSIALLTVSWQSWRVAKRNPVEALRYE